MRIIQSVPSPKAEPFKMWLAEVSATDLSKESDPVGMAETSKVAKQGGSVAKAARKQYEIQSGKKVVSPLNAKNLKELKGKEDE